MKLLTILLSLLATVYSPTVYAVETLRPEQLKSGMKGYGLSVFKGTQIDRFEVEILGVLNNAMPKQDMILIRLSGANLEKSKVVAGMSGSPIFINGKLIGALAYGWGFENDPLAGVTPIHNMLAELRQPLPGRPVPITTTARSPFDARTSLFAVTTPPDNSLRPLLTPLALGGFSPRMIDFMAQEFSRFGLLPVAGGGGSRTPKRATARIEPGSALGVELIRGDLNAVGMGTATYVEGNRILAFGHPAFGAGQIEAPAVLGEIHAIMSSLQRSFKMSTSAGEVGALIGDWQSCIVADTKHQARMIPVTITVNHPEVAHKENYAVEVIDNDALTARLILSAIGESITAASGSSQDTTLHVGLNIELADRTIQVSDTFFNPVGGLYNPQSLSPLMATFNTPYGQPTIKRVAVTVDAKQTRQTAEIRRAYFSKAQVERGEQATLNVVLRPFDKPEITKTISIPVPASTELQRELAVVVTAGSSAPADVAPPDNLNDYLNAIPKRHHSTELVILVPTTSQGLQYRGKLLKNLPASIRGVLDDSTSTDIATAADIKQIVVPTDWILSGQAAVRVPIRQE